VRTKKVYNGKVTEGAAPLHKKISTHIPRHTAGTLIERVAGKDLAALLLGHAEGGVTHTYIHKEQLQAVDALLDAWQKITTKEEAD
jgi:integrase